MISLFLSSILLMAISTTSSNINAERSMQDACSEEDGAYLTSSTNPEIEGCFEFNSYDSEGFSIFVRPDQKAALLPGTHDIGYGVDPIDRWFFLYSPGTDEEISCVTDGYPTGNPSTQEIALTYCGSEENVPDVSFSCGCGTAPGPAPEPTIESDSPIFETASPTIESDSPIFETASPTIESDSHIFETASPTESDSHVFETASPTIEPDQERQVSSSKNIVVGRIGWVGISMMCLFFMF